MLNSILEELQKAQTPARKAAIIADRAINSLPNEITNIARGCVIFHWFNEKIISAITPPGASLDPKSIYERICSLPIVELTPQGATYHDLTRQGLIELYSLDLKDLFQNVSRKAGEAYLGLGKDRKYLAEAFYCLSIAGSPKASELWKQLLGGDVGNTDPQFYQDIVWLQSEAERFPFVKSLYNPILPDQEHIVAEWSLRHPYAMPPNFTGRVLERQLLTDWLQNDHEKCLLIIRALGGFGKSALSWYWLTHDVDPKQWPRVVWWSFYERDASFERFVEETIKYLKLEVPQGQRAQVDRLLKAMQSQKTLLILDGFERLLRAYDTMNAAYQGDEQPKLESNQLVCININADLFLKSICSLPNIKSKVLITTRLTPRSIKPRGEFMIGCREEELTALQKQDAVEFFQRQNIKGTHAEIEEACAAYGYHPLSLRLLSGLIRTDLNSPFDISVAKRISVSEDILQRKHHVLEQAYDSLPTELRRLLSTIACFRSAVELKTLEAFVENKNSLNDDLYDLVDRGLLHFDDKNKKFDLHPIVRRYAYERLSVADRSRVHERLVNYFEALPQPEKVEKLEDLTPMIELYHHMVRASKYDEAWILFRDRIWKTLYYQFGDYQTQIELLTALFPSEEIDLPKLKEESHQAHCLNELANAYSLNGQPRRATSLYETQRIIREKGGNKKGIAVGSGNIADDQLKIGALSAAENNLRRSIDLSREIEDEHTEAIGHREIGRVLSTIGRWQEAERESQIAINMFEKQNNTQTEGYAWAYLSLCYLLMSRANSQSSTQNRKSAIESASHAFELAEEGHKNIGHPNVRDNIRAHWLLGAAYRANSDLYEAEVNLSKAISMCRQINLVEMESDILLDLARLRYDQKNFEEAKTLADEALLITERCGYVLQGADVNLFLAQLALTPTPLPEGEGRVREIDKAKAKEYAEEAKKLATCDGPPYYYKVAYDEAERFLARLQE